MSFTQNERQALWNHFIGCNIDATQDVHGAIIKRDAEPDTEYAWEIDHIFPASVLEKAGVPKEDIDDLINLRILHHSNNESKGDDYPRYGYTTYSLDSESNITLGEKLYVTFNPTTQTAIRMKYAPYFRQLDLKRRMEALSQEEKDAYDFIVEAGGYD